MIRIEANKSNVMRERISESYRPYSSAEVMCVVGTSNREESRGKKEHQVTLPGFISPL